MRVGTKFLLLLLMAVSLATALAGGIVVWVQLRGIEQNAREHLEQASLYIQRTTRELESRQVGLARELAAQPDLQMQLSLLSRYQRPDAYQPSAFDGVKRDLAAKLALMLRVDEQGLLAVYNSRKQLEAGVLVGDAGALRFYQNYDQQGRPQLHWMDDLAPEFREHLVEMQLPQELPGWLLDADQALFRTAAHPVRYQPGDRADPLQVGTLVLMRRLDQRLQQAVERAYQVEARLLGQVSMESSGASPEFRLQSDRALLRLQAPREEGDWGWQIGYDLSRDQRQIWQLVWTLVFAFLGTALLSSVLVYLASVRFLQQPLQRLMQRIAHTEQMLGFAENRCDSALERRDELRQLERSFEAMSMAVLSAFEQQRNLNAELEARVQEEVEKVRQQDRIISMQSRQSAMQELVVNLAHQWRQPLAVMSLAAQMVMDELALRRRGADPDDAELLIEESLGSIVSEATELSATIDRLTEFREHGGGGAAYLDAVVEQVRGLMHFALQQRNVELVSAQRLTQLPALETDPRLLAEILLALLQNSLDAFQARHVSDPQVRIDAWVDAEHGCIAFRDNAGGIDPDLLPRVFDPYVTGDFNARNRGLGLYMVRKTLEIELQGHIEASNQGAGAQFLIWIPVVASD